MAHELRELVTKIVSKSCTDLGFNKRDYGPGGVETDYHEGDSGGIFCGIVHSGANLGYK